MLLSLIICTYKRPDLLKSCLTGAMEVLSNCNSELIVINDCKEDAVSVPVHPKVRLYNNTSRGLASARNLGSKKANGDLLLFIDDDIEFNYDNVRKLLDLSSKTPLACFNPNWRYSEKMLEIVTKKQFGRFLIRVGLTNYKGWVPELDWNDTVFKVHKLAGYFMLIPKKTFEQVGGFDEAFVNQGIEDDIICIKLMQMNIEMYIDPQNYVFHNETDRINLDQRLTRYYNGAINRRKGFEMGYKQYEIVYTKKKGTLIKFLLYFKKPIMGITRLIPNRKLFDALYFKVSNALIGIYIYDGYHKDTLKK